MGKIWPILNGKVMQKVPIMNDQADMRPILNGNLSINSIHLKPKKDPFPSKLYSHIPSRMNLSQTPGVRIRYCTDDGFVRPASDLHAVLYEQPYRHPTDYTSGLYCWKLSL